MKNAKILIIDDQEVNVEILAQILKDAGYGNVYVETDSRRGLARYQQETFDLLLLDLLMPYINGLDILRELQRMRRTAVVDPGLTEGQKLQFDAEDDEYQAGYEHPDQASRASQEPLSLSQNPASQNPASQIVPRYDSSSANDVSPNELQAAPMSNSANNSAGNLTSPSLTTSHMLSDVDPELESYPTLIHEKAYRPVIVLTADTSPGSKYEALSLGANDFITKPFDVQDVLLRTRNLLDMRAMHLQLVSLNQSLEAKVAERTAKLRQMYDKAQHDAFHDPLTDLPNRALFIDRLEQAIGRYKEHLQQNCVVIFADFDRFKVVNDSLGYSAGNDLLVAIAERFERILSSSDSVARLHADEFVLLIQDASSSTVASIISRLQEAFLMPFNIVGSRLYVSMSLGIVTAEHLTDGAEACLHNAELAMHQAKASGRGQYEVFTQDLRERTLMLLQLETHLRYAGERNEFRLAYQPIVSAETGGVSGFEALLRWHHSKYGVVAPGEFIPYAEETGLIVDIDRWVLAQACEQFQTWQTQFPSLEIRLNVNMTTQQLARDDLVQHINDVVGDSQIAPGSINVELIESMLLQDSEWVLAQLAHLRELGVQLYIDDFGTGYSSLSYLQTLSANALKIDRSFVQNMSLGDEGYELVKTILQIAHSLHMTVVAEGVETAAQYMALRELGCDFLQGYYISKPLSAEDAEVFLEQSLRGQTLYQRNLNPANLETATPSTDSSQPSAKFAQDNPDPTTPSDPTMFPDHIPDHDAS